MHTAVYKLDFIQNTFTPKYYMSVLPNIADKQSTIFGATMYHCSDSTAQNNIKITTMQ